MGGIKHSLFQDSFPVMLKEAREAKENLSQVNRYHFDILAVKVQVKVELSCA